MTDTASLLFRTVRRFLGVTMTPVLFLTPASVMAQSRPGGAVGPIRLDTLHWSGKPGGVQLATVEGNPMAADSPYTVALRLGDGAWIQPHWHPRLQHLAVLEGTLLLGHGDEIDSTSAAVLRPGEIGIISATEHHYEGGRGTTTLILYGIGPMTTTYVKPRAP